MRMENVVLSFIVFGTMVALLVSIQGLLSDTYSVSDPAPVGIMSDLDNMTLVQNMNESVAFVYELSDPTASATDIIGSLMISGIGALKSMLGLITFVPEILLIVVRYYPIPTAVIALLVVSFIVSIAFILLNNYTRGQN